ncbi:endonuclease domain-containing protein [Francisella uliginis]|uniref:DNA methylase n=1 Tax=Francisella uliginis TaxID=573570 RepID=A0A1L4BQU1_9GAMM|nr:endonuclease domain-containing protein [Francisella uliginis]API86204.1 DNA methylase [Francisella uliginis]
MRKTKSYYSLPYNPALKQRAKELRKAGNLAEVLLWNQIKNKQFLNLDFDRQKIIGNYIVDFFCGEKMLVLEIDGYSHNDKHDYDYKRDKYLKSLNLKVINLLDNDVKNDINAVLTFLRNHPDLKVTPPAEGNYSPDVIEQDGGGI